MIVYLILKKKKYEQDYKVKKSTQEASSSRTFYWLACIF